MTNETLIPPTGDTAESVTTDVVVVGARCAGAATAMLLAAAGHDVLVVDRTEFPSDTLSTHAIARTGVVQLHRWGLLSDVVESGAPEIRDVMFHIGDTAVTRTIKDRHGVDHLVAPRRHVLDPILQDAARAAGATIRTGVSVAGVHRRDDGRVTGVYGRAGDGRPVSIDARIVIGADGLRSRVARAVGAPMIEVRPSNGATHYTYFAGDWNAMEYYLGDGAFAGIFPTHGGEACIWVCSPDDWAIERRRRHASMDTAFDAMVADAAPELAERLDTCVRTSTSRWMMRTPNHLRHPVGDGWALVGDAGYHRDTITGHGISDAFRDAELLAVAVDDALRGRCVETDALASYHHERDVMLREVFEITCELSLFPRPIASPNCRSSSAPRSTPSPPCWPRGPLRQPPWPPREHRLRPGRNQQPQTPTREEITMTTDTMTTTESTPSNRNGVDTATLFATLDAVKQAPAAAQFQFRAHNEWVTGTHSRSSISDFFGVGEERAHDTTFVFDADHPAVLVGKDNGPTPVEFVLHALASCLTAGIANIAAARKVTLTEVRSTVSGDIDLNGILGLNPDVRNGYQQVTVAFTIKGDAPAEVLREIVEQSRQRSAVYDVITNGVPVAIAIDVA